MKMRKNVWKSFPVCLAVSVLLTALPCLFTDIFYLYGDDYLLNYIANGSFGEKYSAYLVFIKYPAGLMLKALYALAPGVNWYAVLIIGTIALSFAVIHRAILKTTSHPAAIVFSLIMNAVVVPLFLTFTVAAFLAAAAGTALLLTGLRSGQPRRSLIPGIAMLLLSFMIREDCLVPVIGIAAPAFLAIFIRRGSDRKMQLTLFSREQRPVLLSMLILAGVLLILIAGISLLENKVYSDPEWTGYKAYSSARARYLDYPTVPYEQFQGEFLEAGFSKEAYLLINRWTFCEQNVFSREKLSEITDISHRAYTKSYRLRYTLEELTASPIRYCILIPFVLLLFFALTDRQYRSITALLVFCMFGLVLVALAFLRLRVLLRITVPLAMSACAFISLCFERKTEEEPASGLEDIIRQQAAESPASNKDPALQQAAELASGPESILPQNENGITSGRGRIPEKLRYVFAGIFTVLLAIMFVLFFSGYKEAVASLRNKATASSYKAFRKEIDRHPERIYAVERPIYVHAFAWGHTIDEIVPTDTFSHVIRAGSWDNFSPRYYDIANKCGLSDPDNLLSSVVNAENVYFVTEDEGYLLQFLNREYDGTYEAAKVKSKGAARICRIRSK